MTRNASQMFGAVGEALACRYLEREGYKILIRNYECALGEIDVIAKESGSLVFVEVKTRSSAAMGSPSEAVTFHKRNQLTNVALYYLKRYGIPEMPCRFDVVSVVMEKDREAAIELIRDAFYARR